MKTILPVIKNYLSSKGKKWIPIILGIATIMGAIGWTLTGFDPLISVILILVLIVFVLIDFSHYLIFNFGDLFYKYISTHEHFIFIPSKKAIFRDYTNALGKFVPRSLHAKSKHDFEITPVGSNVISAYHEFRRSENSALKWKFDFSFLRDSLKVIRKFESFDLLRIGETAGNIVKLRIYFNPPLTIKEAPVSYSFERKYAGAQFLTKEDIAKAIENDNISHDRPFCIQGRKVGTDTDFLYFSLEFPSWYNVANFAPRVTYRGDIARDIQDQLKVKETRNSKSTTAELSVKKDLINVGYVYSIVWQPPSIEELRESWKEKANGS